MTKARLLLLFASLFHIACDDGTAGVEDAHLADDAAPPDAADPGLDAALVIDMRPPVDQAQPPDAGDAQVLVDQAPPDATLVDPDAAPDATLDATVDAAPPIPDAAPPPASRVVFTELMYHPVREAAYEDQHEFLELHNAGEGAADLSGWALDRGVRYTFADVILAPGETLVVAADPERLALVYDLDGITVLGPYDGRLANSGERVRLVDAAEETVDEVTYDDAFPWPIGADALGASTQWLPEDVLPVEDHALRGRSLQRRSFEAPTDDPANWQASALDGADPGAVATVGAGVPAGTVVELAWSDGAPGPVPPDAPITLRVRLAGAVLANPRVEWFADDVQIADEPIESVALVEAGEGWWHATLPAQPDETILRVRVVTEESVISPRPRDPMAWHAAFVGTPIEGTTRPYRLYIAPADWTALWDAVSGGRVLNRCEPNPGWGLRVPAVFVHAGQVYDVRVRYQGSRWNRTRGPNIGGWDAPGPDRPDPMRSLSWSIRFPRYARFEGRSAIILNKLTQGCPGLTAGVGFGLFGAVGLPVPQVRYTRLFINGGYFNYNLEIERPGEEMLTRWLGEYAEDHPDAPPEPGVPHLFKASGCNCDEGPYGWGDGRVLGEHCGYDIDQRYAWTYERKTWDFADHTALRALIEAHDAARDGTDEELAAFLAEHFDVDLVLSYIAVINWAVPFDDMFHNHYWLQRDRTIGGSSRPGISTATSAAGRAPTHRSTSVSRAIATTGRGGGTE